MDRPAAQALVDARKREVASFAGAEATSEDALTAAEQRVASAQSRLEQQKQELHTLEGALSQVGGASHLVARR